jgi:hypothetical protein
MAGKINLQPEVLDLGLYAGDGVSFRMIITNGSDAPLDITGSVQAQIRLKRLDPDPPVVAFAVNMTDAYQGIVRLSLTGEQTAELSQHESANGGKFTGEWDVQWSPAQAEPRTLMQGKVECSADVTR